MRRHATDVDYYRDSHLHPAGDVPGPAFAVGDRVWALDLYRENETGSCRVCNGTGRVSVQGSTRRAVCPEDGCHFGSVTVRSDVLYYSARPLTLGQVRHETTVERWSEPERGADQMPVIVRREVRYMAVQTGIGSGQSWPEGRLFATAEQARAHAEAHGAVNDGGAALREEHRARTF